MRHIYNSLFSDRVDGVRVAAFNVAVAVRDVSSVPAMWLYSFRTRGVQETTCSWLRCMPACAQLASRLLHRNDAPRHVASARMQL